MECAVFKQNSVSGFWAPGLISDTCKLPEADISDPTTGKNKFGPKTLSCSHRPKHNKTKNKAQQA